MYDREVQEYRKALGEAIWQGVLNRGQEEAPAQEAPQQHGHGSVDGGAHGPEPTRTKTDGDHILDAIYGGDHSDGVSWTRGRG